MIYTGAMHERTHTQSEPTLTAQWIAVLVIVGVAMAGTAAWLHGGDSLFVTLVQQGLAWCF